MSWAIHECVYSLLEGSITIYRSTAVCTWCCVLQTLVLASGRAWERSYDSEATPCTQMKCNFAAGRDCGEDTTAWKWAGAGRGAASVTIALLQVISLYARSQLLAILLPHATNLTAVGTQEFKTNCQSCFSLKLCLLPHLDNYPVPT